MSKRLTRTKFRKFNRRMFGFDVETAEKNRKFVLATIYDLKSEEYFTFTSKKRLIAFFKHDRFRNSLVVASNLSFDFFALLFGSKEVENFKTLFRGSDLICAKTYVIDGKFSCKTIPDRPYHKLEFIDTMNYAQLSVEKAGKIIGIPKLDKPEFLGNWPKSYEQFKELERYCARDSEISCKFLRYLYSAFEELGANAKITLASTAMSLFRNRYLDNTYYVNKKRHILHEFEGYYGGRCEVFARGSFASCKDARWKYYDFNSLYPSMMLNEFPDPNSFRKNRKNTMDYIRKYHGMSRVDIFCPDMDIPLLPFRTKDKLLFPTGHFSGWYSHIELRKAEELEYVITKVHECHYYKEACFPFRTYVQDLYALRKRFQAEKNPMEYVVKILMNSLYGKFGQKFQDRENVIPFATIDDIEKYSQIERIGDYARVKQDSNPSVFCFPIWAAYITAYGRLKLYDAIVQHDAIYCDTDSFITTDDIPESQELGELKKEMDIDEGCIVRPKFYALKAAGKEYVKIKGLNRRLMFSEFACFIINPRFESEKFVRFKESLRRGFIPNEIIKIHKQLSLEDTKREWAEIFNPRVLQYSRPINRGMKDGRIDRRTEETDGIDAHAALEIKRR